MIVQKLILKFFFKSKGVLSDQKSTFIWNIHEITNGV